MKDNVNSNKDKKAKKDKRIPWFDIAWFFLILLIIIWLFCLTQETKQVERVEYKLIDDYKFPHVILDIPENRVKYISEAQMQELVSRIENNLNTTFKKDIDFLQISLNTVSYYIGLFAALITAISIFFSLRESNRVNSVIKKYELMVEKYNVECLKIEKKNKAISKLEEKLKNHLSDIESKKDDFDKLKNDFIKIKADLENKRDEFYKDMASSKDALGSYVRIPSLNQAMNFETDASRFKEELSNKRKFR